MRIINFFTFASFTQEIILDNETFKFLITWNSRGQYFSLSITDVTGNALVSGMKLLLNAEPFHLHPGRDLPAGELLVIDTTESNAPINQNDFTNGRLQLIYIEETEL